MPVEIAGKAKMASRPVLILGGTGEARALATVLIEEGYHVISSLAGVTENPILPSGEIRIGGFGGSAGLEDYLCKQHIEVMIDATHPYAAQISRNAFAAAEKAGIPLLRLERAPWQPCAGDRWSHVADMAHAVARLPDGAKVLVTTGRKSLGVLFGRKDISGVVRSIEIPSDALPENWGLVLDRPPHDLRQEMALMRAHAISHLLTKNSGGDATYAKILTARELGLDVFMIDRPAKPVCPTFETLADLATALCNLAR